MSRPLPLAVFTLIVTSTVALLHEQSIRKSREAAASELREAVAANLDLVQRARDDISEGDAKAGQQKLSLALVQVSNGFGLWPDGLHPILDIWFTAILRYRNAAFGNAPLRDLEEELDRLVPEIMRLAGR